MVIIKKKSIIVVVVSSIVLSAVLVITLFSYLFYLNLKDNEAKAAFDRRSNMIKENSAKLHGGGKR